jgi:hypothetical protein
VNDAPPAAAVVARQVGGETACIVPLVAPAPAPDAVVERYLASITRRDEALASSGRDVAVLRCEPGHGQCVRSVPRSGTYRFQRTWPSPTAVDARAPGGLRVATDGRVALLRLDLGGAEGRIEIDLPPVEQAMAGEPATALVVFGVVGAPSLIVNGRAYEGPTGETELGGERAVVFPLPGVALESAMAGLDGRYAAAMARVE